MITFNKKNLFVGILTISIFTSCTSKNLNIISQDTLFDKGLENTKISNIVHKNNTKVLINATYLNPTDPSIYDNGKEVFLVGIYYSLINSTINQNGLNNKNYTLTLNSKSIYSKRALTNKDELFKNIPVENKYAKYFIVKFKNDKSKELTLSLVHKTYGKSISIFKTF